MNRFRKSYPEFPQGKLEFGDDPDLIVYTRDGRLGIEHTRIFRSPLLPHDLILQEQESLQERIVDFAREKYQRISQSQMLVYVYYNDKVRLTKRDVEDTASAVSDIVRQSNLAVGEKLWMRRSLYARRGLGQFPRAIKTIYVEHVSEPGFSLWGVPRGDVVPKLTAEQIQAKINEKEDKIESYQSNCENVWLLIVADGFAPSSHFIIDDAVTNHTYSTRFDRVFYLHNFTCAVTELETDPKRHNLSQGSA